MFKHKILRSVGWHEGHLGEKYSIHSIGVKCILMEGGNGASCHMGKMSLYLYRYRSYRRRYILYLGNCKVLRQKSKCMKALILYMKYNLH